MPDTFQPPAPSNDWFLKYTLHHTSRSAMEAFLRHTEKTPALGGSSYTFRINATSEVAVKKFISNIRVTVSRLRKEAQRNNIKMAHFVVSLVSADPIVKINELTDQPEKIGTIIQLERRKTQRRAIPESSFTDFVLLLELPSTSQEDIRNTELADIVKELALHNSYKFKASNWSDMLAATWLVDKNYVVYKGYNDETQEHEIGRY